VFEQIGFNVKEVGDIVCDIIFMGKQQFHFFKVEFLAFVTCTKITKTKGFFKVKKNRNKIITNTCLNLIPNGTWKLKTITKKMQNKSVNITLFL
jgi:hypothetical protein